MRIFPEPRVEMLPESAKTQRITQDQDIDSVRRGGILCGGLWIHRRARLRQETKNRETKEGEADAFVSKRISLAMHEHGIRFQTNSASRQDCSFTRQGRYLEIGTLPQPSLASVNSRAAKHQTTTFFFAR